jgi:membrane protein YqaA with SNARE-associated domain
VLTLLSLFTVAFASATILPLQSELMLTALIVGKQYKLATLLLVAGTGNTLGAAVNWQLGRKAETYKHRPWFPVSSEKLVAAQARYHRFGKYSLLLSWLPIGGDALTVAAGLMREPLPVFLAFVAIAKFGRYIALAYFVSGFS